jgi:transcriptional regulator with XRE-family HTH domain
MSDFSEFLKESLEKLNITREEIGRALEVAPRTISDWQKGFVEPLPRMQREITRWLERRLKRQERIEKNAKKIEESKKEFQVWMYGMQGYDDFLANEYDTLEEAVDAVRGEWPYPQKIILPNGEDYDFTKDGDEWKRPVIYNYMVFKDVEMTPPQIHLLKQIEKDPDLRFFMRLMKMEPQSYSAIVADDESDMMVKKMETLLKLIHCGLIEFVPFYDGSGIRDKRWRR